MTRKQFHKNLFLLFFCGYFFHIAVICTFQDWLGLDDYLEIVRNNWTNSSWVSWGLFGLLVLGLAIRICFKFAKHYIEFVKLKENMECLRKEKIEKLYFMELN